jgi:hypothetical protein
MSITFSLHDVAIITQGDLLCKRRKIGISLASFRPYLNLKITVPTEVTKNYFKSIDSSPKCHKLQMYKTSELKQ